MSRVARKLQARAHMDDYLRPRSAMLPRAPRSWAGDQPDEPPQFLSRPRLLSADARLGEHPHTHKADHEASRHVDDASTRAEADADTAGAPAIATAPTRDDGAACSSEAERTAMYRADIDAYTPRPPAPHAHARSRRANSPPSRPPQAAPPPISPPAELVECDDGGVRPAVGLCFAFVANPEKLDLMLHSGDHSGEVLIETRRRASLEAATPTKLIEMDSRQARVLDCEVQSIVAQRRAPAPRKMRKPAKLRRAGATRPSEED